ncbi:putative mitochondrial protein AtMg01250 [Nicotiana tabacum]|uniref:Mitochondrial protein AtMg01250 n=1 Tax=Nicotiana tabacum TaxID=4097 RepID=A0AC58U1X2_TOBAC
MAGVWYSIIINGARTSFFTSTQGLKQGDPLSPSLFIIGAEVLSRSLNELNDFISFTPFSMDHRGTIINHLAYVDGIVIICRRNNITIRLIKKVIDKYEKASGQKVNNDKNFFIAPHICANRIN